MKKVLSTIAVFALALASLNAATRTTIEVKRVYGAAGNVGCTVSGATEATPSVVTCAAAHNLVDGDPIQVTGVGGTTTLNTVGYAKVTGYSATTFGMYTDAALSAGQVGTGTYTSGGKVSQAIDISGFKDANSVVNDWTLRVRLSSLTAAKNVLISVQDSADGFASDVRTIAVFSATGAYGNPYPTQEWTVRAREVPMTRFGITNGRLRIAVQAIDGSASVSISAWIE